MIPVAGKPLIEHAIETLKAGNITEIVIITGWKKGALIDYCGRGDLFGAKITYITQEDPLGLGHAISLAEEWVEGKTFAVVYGDTIIEPKSLMRNMVELHKEKKAACTLLVHPVEDPQRFGIVKFEEDSKIKKMIEKPSLDVAESLKVNEKYYGIAGAGIFEPLIFAFIKKCQESGVFVGKEIDLTVPMQMLIESGFDIYAYHDYIGEYNDVGTWKSYLEMEKRMLNNKTLEELVDEREIKRINFSVK